MNRIIFSGRRVLPVDGPACVLADWELEQMQAECTTFLDQCTAEAAQERWFPCRGHRHSSTIHERALAAIAAHGPCSAHDLQAFIGHRKSACETVARELLAAGEIVCVGKDRRGGRLYKIHA